MELILPNPIKARAAADAIISALEPFSNPKDSHPFDIIAALQVVTLGAVGLFPDVDTYKTCVFSAVSHLVDTLNEIPDDCANQGKLLKIND